MKKLLVFLSSILVTAIVVSASICFALPRTPGSGTGPNDGTGSLTQGAGKDLKSGKSLEVTIFAAASTQHALDQIKAKFLKNNPGIKFRVSYASSGQLAHQIMQGAPADIFICAHAKWMEKIEQEGLINDSYPDLLSNELVLIASKDINDPIETPANLKNERISRIAVADVASVPAGMYAKQALSNLSLWGDLRSKVISGSNVRTTLAFVERGEIDYGIVYASDASISENVNVIHTFDPSTHAQITYPIALLKSGYAKGIARKLFRELISEKSTQSFISAGFKVNPQDVSATS